MSCETELDYYKAQAQHLRTKVAEQQETINRLREQLMKATAIAALNQLFANEEHNRE